MVSLHLLSYGCTYDRQNAQNKKNHGKKGKGKELYLSV